MWYALLTVLREWDGSGSLARSQFTSNVKFCGSINTILITREYVNTSWLLCTLSFSASLLNA
jgi:hypothetical protein